MEILHREDNKFHRSDYPIARVAYEVYQLRATLAAIFKVELPERDVKDFIPKFTYAKSEPEDLMSPEEVHKLRMQQAKENQAMRLGMFGLDTEGKQIRDTIMPSLRALTEVQQEALEQLKIQEQNAKAAQGQHDSLPPLDTPMRSAMLRQVKGRKKK